MRKFIVLALLINLYFTAKGQLALEWQRQLWKGNFSAYGSTADKMGNSYILAYSTDTAHDAIIKYNSNGILVWEKQYFFVGSLFTTDDSWECINVDNKGNIYFVDCKNGTNSFYLVKLDSNGNVIYENRVASYYQGSYHYLYVDNNDFVHLTIQDYGIVKTDTGEFESDYLSVFRIDSQGNSVGYFAIPTLSTDFQMITDTQNNTYIAYDNESRIDSTLDGIYVSKVDTSGTVLWTIRNIPFISAFGRLSWAKDGNLIENWEGYNSYGGIYILDPNTGDSIKGVTVIGLSNYFWQTDVDGNIYVNASSGLVKYDDNLNLKYTIQLSDSLGPDDLVLGNDKSIYIVGLDSYFSGRFTIFVEKVDSNGNEENYELLRDSIDDEFGFNVNSDSMGNLYITVGLYNPIDTNLQEAVGLLKFCPDCGINISGTIFNDINKNCIPDSGEKHLSNRLVELLPGNLYTVTDSSGNYFFHSDIGSYSVHEILPNHFWKFTCDSIYNFSIDSINQVISNLNFGNIVADTINDLAIKMAASPMQSGYNGFITLNYSNIGSRDLNATVTLKLDESFSYISATNSPTYIYGDTIMWNVGLLRANNYGQINLLCHVSAFDTINQPYKIISWIYPIVNDNNPSNNVDSITDFIEDSYDPNEKIVYPLSSRMSGNIIAAAPVTYQINFQNTGTDTARTIMIQDVLDPQLDISTFTMNAAINPYSLSIVNGRTLQWTFNNIQLPDSGHNQTGSHGFLSYSIAAKPNSTHSDVMVMNTASIYFDYNKPVGTDTVKLVEHGQPIVYTATSLLIYPNPSYNETMIQYSLPRECSTKVEMYDLFGRQLLQQDMGNQEAGLYRYKINLSTFASGIYIVRLRTTFGDYTSKLSVIK